MNNRQVNNEDEMGEIRKRIIYICPERTMMVVLNLFLYS